MKTLTVSAAGISYVVFGSESPSGNGSSVGADNFTYSMPEPETYAQMLAGALLEFLAREQGRVVGRAEIAEHVWDESFDPFSNLIEVYINRLRRKIDEGCAVPLIHTRRGAGYVLEVEPRC